MSDKKIEEKAMEIMNKKWKPKMNIQMFDMSDMLRKTTKVYKNL